MKTRPVVSIWMAVILGMASAISSATWDLPLAVPLERLIPNLIRRVRANPEDAASAYVLGRCYSLAFVHETQFVTLWDWNDEPDFGWPDPPAIFPLYLLPTWPPDPKDRAHICRYTSAVQRHGEITSGRQLLGSVTWWMFFEHGYLALGALDNNGDGVLKGRELSKYLPPYDWMAKLRRP